MAGDWLTLEQTINDLSARVITQSLGVTSSPTFGGLTVGVLAGVIKGTVGVLSGGATFDDVADGSSTTKRTNFNADLLDGQHGSYYASAGGYVPYTGATAILNMGAFGINAASFTASVLGGATERIVIASTAGLLTTYPGILWNSTSKQMLVSQNASVVPVELSGTVLACRGDDGVDVRINISSYGTGVLGAYANLHSRGTAALPTAIQSGDRIFSIEGWGRGTTANSSAPRAGLAGFATENWTDAAQGTALRFGTTLIGSLTTAIRWSILDNGSLVSGTAGATANNILTTGTIGAGAITCTNLTDSAITNTYIPYSSTAGGLLAGSANLTFTTSGLYVGTNLGIGAAINTSYAIVATKTSTLGSATGGIIGSATNTKATGIGNTGAVYGLNFIVSLAPESLLKNGGLTCPLLQATYINMSVTTFANEDDLYTITKAIGYGWSSVVPTFTRGVGATGALTITSFNEFETVNPSCVNGSTITTLCGFYDGGLTAGDTNWGFAVNTQSYINGNLRIGSAVTPTVALDVTGAVLASTSITAGTGFGCNSKTAQTAYASGGALSAYATGAFGFDSDAHCQEIHTLLTNIRAALVANGIMS